jgi:DNA-binding NtrC family response regulator
LSDDRDRLTRQLVKAQALSRLIGAAPVFRAAIETVEIAAESDAPVLITGETGTGKELIARAVHYLGDRAAFPFVAINCGALTDTLLSDELFGHERGAFTDAHRPRIGLLAQADRGTVLLDEVDALTPRGQVALLRVLQDRRFRPLGSNVERLVDVRFLAASNASLRDSIESGVFRADLYYRLSVFSIALPPIRERGRDVLPLARHFLDLHAPQAKRGLRLSREAEETLLAHDWPGNVRELENVILRAAWLCKTDCIEAAHLGLARRISPTSAATPIGPFKALKANALRVFERQYLEQLLAATEGNVTKAALTSGKERRDLGRLLKKHQIEPRAFAKRRA